MDNADPDYREIIESLRGAGHYSGRPPLPPLSEHGNGDDMEPRIARLEAHMEHVRSDLGKLSTVPADIAAMKRDIEHLPSKEYMVKIALGSLGVIAGLIMFGEKLQGLLH